MGIRVLDPTFSEITETSDTTIGLKSLEGRTVGLLDNSKLNVKEFLNYVEELLRSRHGVTNVVRLKKPDASRPAPPEVLAQMTGCDAVISAVGDWGSCSSCSLHDAILAEKQGIRATAVITDRFVQTAKVMAQVSGKPEHPFAVIAHPISNNTDAALREKAEAAVQQCVAILVER
jgi:hypothetical protein